MITDKNGVEMVVGESFTITGQRRCILTRILGPGELVEYILTGMYCNTHEMIKMKNQPPEEVCLTHGTIIALEKSAFIAGLNYRGPVDVPAAFLSYKNFHDKKPKL